MEIKIVSKGWFSRQHAFEVRFPSYYWMAKDGSSTRLSAAEDEQFSSLETAQKAIDMRRRAIRALDAVQGFLYHGGTIEELEALAKKQLLIAMGKGRK